MEGHDDVVWAVASSHTSGLLASGSADMSIRLWDVHHARTVKRMDARAGHVYVCGPVHSHALSPHPHTLAHTHTHTHAHTHAHTHLPATDHVPSHPVRTHVHFATRNATAVHGVDCRSRQPLPGHALALRHRHWKCSTRVEPLHNARVVRVDGGVVWIDRHTAAQPLHYRTHAAHPCTAAHMGPTLMARACADGRCQVLGGVCTFRRASGQYLALKATKQHPSTPSTTILPLCYCASTS